MSQHQIFDVVVSGAYLIVLAECRDDFCTLMLLSLLNESGGVKSCSNVVVTISPGLEPESSSREVLGSA